MALGVLPSTAAHADGIYRWQNQRNGGFLEVWLSSHSNGAQVITWSSNPGSNNQWWADYKLTDGYYLLQNYNSSKHLDRFDSPSSSGDCSAYQYSSTGDDWQRWRYERIWSDYHGRYFVRWINKYGCNGDPWWAFLAAHSGQSDVYTFQDDACVPGAIPDACYWRRNGE
ncbi:RICIN domain-containing protein [Streptosporangium sp. NPDC050280]|uniref:RICIN domain-containing protein n=1 Tax=unclassified Streptosporangium TaxID=2632669 RepID=UPI00342DF01C